MRSELKIQFNSILDFDNYYLYKRDLHKDTKRHTYLNYLGTIYLHLVVYPRVGFSDYHMHNYRLNS